MVARDAWGATVRVGIRILLAIWSFENVRRPVTQNHEVVIFVIVTTFLLLVAGTNESEVVGVYTTLLLFMWGYFAFARLRYKWANPDHARRWERIEMALVRHPTEEMMKQAYAFVKTKRMFAEDCYYVALELVEFDPQKMRRVRTRVA